MADEVLLYSGQFDESMVLPYYEAGVKAGFPSPAQDYLSQSLDFNRDLIKHPEATFYARVIGDSMKDAGINDGDIVVIDRALGPQDGDIVVAYIDGEFTMKYFDVTHKEDGYIELIPANDKYPRIRVEGDENFNIWGVIVWTIKKPCKR